ncbi:hypothetical protein BD413DRAFT_513499 [Trametes elegans]|nr:hypothetical protein BD413DRAFT_513499 [Trametes elegans]
MQSPLVLSFTAFLLFLLLLVASPAAARAAVNRTIDDELGDSATGTKPVYSPAGSWSQGAACAACRFAPPLLDPTRVRNGTWHDATYSPGGPALTISANFTGSAVYVFNVLAGGCLERRRSSTSRRFVNIPGDRAAFEYDVPVYANASIPHGPHTLTIESGGGANRTNVLFDYILYTVRDHDGGDKDEDGDDDGTTPSASPGAQLPKLQTDDSDPSSDSDSDDDNDGGSHNGGHFFGHRHSKGPDVPVGAIVGGTLGGLALLALVVAAVVFVRRRPRRMQGDDDEKQLHGDPSPPARPIPPHRPTIPGWSTRPSAADILTEPARPTVTMDAADDSFKGDGRRSSSESFSGC